MTTTFTVRANAATLDGTYETAGEATAAARDFLDANPSVPFARILVNGRQHFKLPQYRVGFTPEALA